MSFLNKVKAWFQKFFYGRHGIDELGVAILLLGLVFSFVSGLFRNSIVHAVFYFLQLSCWVIMILRMISKDHSKRYVENAKFLAKWNPVKNRISAFRNRVKDKDHKYFKCSCGMWLRVPKGNGKIKVTCSKCGRQMIKKS